ncbi:MAG: 30S ribosomal protein S8 [Armatimonadetes bacterium]|nr:30S ribosomal protein S8 [Armatimonadota bacterium]
MPTTDPIADMLTRIRNANKAKHDQCDVPASKMKEQIAKVLKREGFIKDYQMIQTGVQGVLRILLKYTEDGTRVITGLKRVSRPGIRTYVGKEEIPQLYGGLGTVIMSTPQGVMTGKKARKQGVGGEILAYIW